MEDKQMKVSKEFREVSLNDVETISPQFGGGGGGPKSLKFIMPDIVGITIKDASEKRGRNSYTLDHSSNNKRLSESSSNSGGYIRHIVAILALSSIVLANMNRQAYNQALASRMIRKVNDTTTEKTKTKTEIKIETTTITATTETASFSVIPEYYDTEAPQFSIPSEFNSSDVDNLNGQMNKDDDRFDWDRSKVSLLQSAFSYGYTPFMIPGGRLCEIYGAKWIVFLSGFGSALCSALTPFLADNSFSLLVASRILMGICQTGVSPALYALLTRWLPAQESNVYLPMMKVGVMIGFSLGSSISGFFHWRTTFHLVATISIIWSLLWMVFISSDPQEHKFIGQKELKYIQTELESNNKGRKMSVGSARRRSAPWFNILTNPVVICFVLAKFTVKLSTDAQTIQLPKYLTDVFDVSSELNGVLNGMNFAIQAVFTGFVAWTAKECIERKLFGMNKTHVRRLSQGICNFGMASAYILISFNMSSLAVVCFGMILLSITSMFGAGGEAMTPVDLSTEYSASIMAIANSAANISGIVLPPLISFILDGQTTDPIRWNIAWWVVGAIITVGGLLYSCRVEAELQEFRPEPKGSIHNNGFEMK